ncbi:MotE family protein [Rhodocista pekingensis]|uniref:MotE family protein n=1 Tax=Rhodocista pekingensis TaxID=201185 RepID=A0ABW2KQZ0_9PROT
MTSAPLSRSSAPPPPARAKAAPRRVAKPAAAPKPPPRSLFSRFRLLPLTIFAAVLLLGARVVDIWTSVASGTAFPEIASSVADPGTAGGLPRETRTQVADNGQAKPAETAGQGAAQPAAPESAPPAAPEAPSAPPGQTFTPSELEILQRLQDRREQLDQRSRGLDQREALLQVAEQRLDQKIGELQTLRGEIQALLRTVNEEQQAQLDSIVKIYETMKPKEAAAIFEALDDTVLLNVLSRMKETKAAPILASMDPKRAQEVTIMLADRKKLPSLPE